MDGKTYEFFLEPNRVKMKERVEIIKNLYPKYLILLKIKDKLKCIGIDKNIIETFWKRKNKKCK